jgi:phosphatidylglycerol:prolipoprotein diacylglycerol transferase
MYPVLFEAGSLKIYSYGFFIAIGAILGIGYLVLRGKKELGLTFDQANSLFLFIFAAAFIGGKVFLFFDDTSAYRDHPMKLLTGSGFVFYGSFLFAIPTMWWFFKKHALPAYAMLDIMAVTTCLVHMFGRIGCFMAGCCHGKPTAVACGVTFTNPACQAQPLNEPLHPTQLYEAGFILIVMITLLYFRDKRLFYGQLFLSYLLLYAFGRFMLEFFRGDAGRGFVIEDYVSHSQFIALLMAAGVLYFYSRWSVRNRISLHKVPV